MWWQGMIPRCSCTDAGTAQRGLCTFKVSKNTYTVGQNACDLNIGWYQHKYLRGNPTPKHLFCIFFLFKYVASHYVRNSIGTITVLMIHNVISQEHAISTAWCKLQCSPSTAVIDDTKLVMCECLYFISVASDSPHQLQLPISVLYTPFRSAHDFSPQCRK